MRSNNCPSCGDTINPSYGTSVCPQCGGTKCGEFCIPGGNRTLCVNCEEQNASEETDGR